ncbi:MAG: nucleotidyltransferase domain-containing protein [Deltaproteobacteria bacterium]|nr:MAG: nucleotidyltransferase domain-containing protein [Deltaproteobacteria bacterium]
MGFENEIAGKLADHLRSFEQVRFALLFGSRAWNNGHAHSDIDLAVFVDPRLSARERFELRLSLAAMVADLGEPDVVILNDAPALLRHRALRGKLLFCRDKREYVGFFVRSVDEWLDQRYWAELFHCKRKERLKEGRFGRP